MLKASIVLFFPDSFLILIWWHLAIS